MLGAKTDIHVAAHLDADGNVSVTVRGSRTYGKKGRERECFIGRDITDKKTLAEIKKVLTGAIDHVRDEVDEHATNAAVEAYGVAIKKGEAI